MDTQQAIHEANVLREFCAHPGFAVLQREVGAKINDSRNEWLKAKDKDSAEAIRIQTQAWGDVENLLKRLMMKGDAAKVAAELKQQGE